jgi:hypothetical protein
MVSDADPQFESDTTWSITQVVWANQSAIGENMTVVTVGDPNYVLQLRNISGSPTWSVFYQSGTQSARVNLTASDPQNLTKVGVTRSGDTLTLEELNGSSTSISVNGTSADGRLNASGFEGRVDELRVFPDALNSSQKTQLATYPVRPVDGTTPLMRVMFDVEDDGIPAYFISGGFTAGGSEVAVGLSGETMSRAGVLSENDYRWRNEGPEILATDSGRLAGAPVAWATYTALGQAYGVVTGFADAVNLLPVVFVVLVAGLVVATVARFRS